MRSIDGLRPNNLEGADEDTHDEGEVDVMAIEDNIFSGLISNPELEAAYEGKISEIKNNSRNSFYHALRSPVVVYKGFARAIRAIAHIRFGYKSLAILALLTAFAGFFGYRGDRAMLKANELSEEAKYHLLTAIEHIDSGNMASAMSEADLANENIKQLKLLAQSWGQDAKAIQMLSPKNSKIAFEEKLLDSTKLILDSFKIINNSLTVSLKNSVSGNGPANLPLIDFSKMSVEMTSSLNAAEKNLETASKNMESLKKDNPKYFNQEYEKSFQAIAKASSFIASAKNLSDDGFASFSGMDGSEKEYLLLFQNNSELRGSGGFLGSFAIMKLKNGKLTSIDFNTNIYKFDKDYISKNQTDPPKELSYLVSNWSMKDSNFAIDFKESSDKVKEFYALESGKKVDGIIAMDTTMFIRLLEVTGPIEIPEYKMTISHENFLKDVQYEVEKGYFDRPNGKQENEPKKILAYMMPRFLTKLSSSLQDQQQAIKIAEVLSESMRQKSLLFNFNEEHLQDFVEKQNVGGRVKNVLYDYFFIHNTNIGGMKSSLNIDQTIEYKVNIADKGNITGEVSVLRNHIGSMEWPDGINKNLVRILLPQNSKINSFENIEGNFYPVNNEKFAEESYFVEGEEAGKAKISFWQNTEPKNSSLSKITYTSNYTVDVSGEGFVYSIYMQKQPGAKPDEYEFEINYPSGFQPENVKNFDKLNKKITLKFQLKEDKLIRIKFKSDN